MPKISFSTVGLIDKPIEEVIELAAAWGFSGIDLCVSPRGHVRHDTSAEQLERIRRRALSHAVQISSLYGYGGRGLLGGAVGVDEANIRSEFSIATRLGANRLRVFAGHEGEAPEHLGDFANSLRPLCEAALREGLLIIIPTHNDLAGDAGRATAMFERLGQDAVRLIFNSATLELAGMDPLAQLDACWPMIDRLEIKDFQIDQSGRAIPVPLGEGQASLDAVLAAALGRGFDGWMTVHYLRNLFPEAEDALTALPKSRSYLQRLLAPALNA